MIGWLSRYFSSIPGVFIDGAIYAAIAFYGALAVAFGSDEARIFIKPIALFWLKTVCATKSATLLAIKMYRSTGFADHQQNKKDDATRMFVKANLPNP